LQEALNVDTYGFKEDPLRGVLYVDMSELKTVTIGDATTLKNYTSETADNCLFFMPQGFVTTGLGNMISKQDDGTYDAIGDIKVYDQQPFFTPYAFNTGTFKALYEREGTINGENTKAKVRNMAAVLPFSIKLDNDGHPYLNGEDVATPYITFRDITGSGELTGVKKDNITHPLTYAVVAQATKTGLASANSPYYVTVAEDHAEGFTFSIPGADFVSSGTVEGTTANPNSLTLQNGTWTGHGTYSGGQQDLAENLWYFSKDLFWKSSQLKDYTKVNVRPFRAYYITTDNTGSNAKATVVFDLNDIVTTGISNINAASSKTGKVYTIDGRYVGNSLENLAPGIYIQNGRKVVKQ
jgi:hypothetical protein